MAPPASPSRRKTFAASTMCFLAGSQGAAAFSAASSPARCRSGSSNLPAASFCGPSSAAKVSRRFHAAVTKAFSPITEADHERDTPPLPMEESSVVACIAAPGQQQHHRHHSLIEESLPGRPPARNFDANILLPLSALLFLGNIGFEIWNGCSVNSLPFSQTFFLLFICNSIVELAARGFLAKR